MLPAGFGHRQAGANRRGNRLVDQVNFARAHRRRRFRHGTLFNRRAARRHADDDSGPGEVPRSTRLADEMTQHHPRGLEVGNDAIADGANHRDRAGHASEHLLGLGANRQYSLLATGRLADCNYRGLVAHETFPAPVDESIRSAEIDCEVFREFAREPPRKTSRETLPDRPENAPHTPPPRHTRISFMVS